MTRGLAIRGGAPVHGGGWPAWPQADEHTVTAVGDVLRSGRWTISGASLGGECLEQKWARRFAAFNEVAYCVPTDHGSSALVVALEALDVGAGDEVIVPGLTWVATASCALNVGALPIIVDVDPETLCMPAAAVRAAITPRTRAILPVHLYASMCDLDELTALGVPVIEDCAHVHGARWRGRRAGSVGAIGCFSMQQGKLRTAGEGGAAIASDERRFRRMSQARSVGRLSRPGGACAGDSDLDMVGELQGTNFCISELQAAVLLDRVEHLDAQVRTRAERARRLDAGLAQIPGVWSSRRPTGVTLQSYYHYVIRFEPEAFAGRSAAQLAEALTAELGTVVGRIYPPLHRHPLYSPRTKRRFRINEEHWERLDQSRVRLPVAEHAWETSLTLHHRVLLGSERDIDDIVEAVAKVARLAAEI